MGTTHNKNSHISSPLPTLRRRKRSNAENRAALFCWKGLWKHPFFFLSPQKKTLLASPRLFRGSCVTPMWKHCLNGTGSSAKYFRVHSKAPDIFFFYVNDFWRVIMSKYRQSRLDDKRPKKPDNLQQCGDRFVSDPAVTLFEMKSTAGEIVRWRYSDEVARLGSK